jgi:hypothetical protein
LIASFAIDNIFVYHGRIDSYYVSPIINGLSDHEAQYLVLRDVFHLHKNKKLSFRTRIISKEATTEFQNMLMNENWDEVLQQKEINEGFNVF